MNTVNVLLVVLLSAASVVCGFAVWAIIELVKTARAARTLSTDLDVRLVPLLEKADVTVDAMNAELLRIDAIVTRMEEVTDRVSSTSRTVQEVANAPVEIVTEFADRVRHAWRTRKTQGASESSSSDETPSTGEESEDGTSDAPETGYEPEEAAVASGQTAGDDSPNA